MESFLKAFFLCLLLHLAENESENPRRCSEWRSSYLIVDFKSVSFIAECGMAGYSNDRMVEKGQKAHPISREQQDRKR